MICVHNHFLNFGATFLLTAVAAPQSLRAAQSWGGSVGFTSDYLVRGITRSDNQPSLQGDVHFATADGFLAGAFASTVQIAPGESRNAELGAFVGFAWESGTPWHLKIVASHYSYPWNKAGSQYDYDELNVDVGYSDWITFSALYSPNAPRYLPYLGLIGVTAKSAELNFQYPLLRKLRANAGLGYERLAGPNSGGYAYWSVGVTYDLAPATLSVAYVDSSYTTTDLYYDAAAQQRWVGAVIWRF